MAAVATAAVAAIVLGASPARADPAGPTNYESTVLAVEPPSDDAAFAVTGGDAFLEVTVAPGHEVSIPGYLGEPYVRIDADGGVWLNEDSPALYLNEERFGEVIPPGDADGRGEPRWRRVASGGRYAWHDHRVHWMSRDVPPAVTGDTRQVVLPWEIPVAVDGVDTVLVGELVWVPSKSPLPALLLGMVALLPFALRRRVDPRVLAGSAMLAATVAGLITLAQNWATPSPARGLPVWITFAALALLAALWAITRGPLGSHSPMHLLFVAGVTLLAWAVSTIEVLWMPVLPSTLPAGTERLGVALVLWAGGAVTAVTLATLLRDGLGGHTPGAQSAPRHEQR